MAALCNSTWLRAKSCCWNLIGNICFKANGYTLATSTLLKTGPAHRQGWEEVSSFLPLAAFGPKMEKWQICVCIYVYMCIDTYLYICVIYMGVCAFFLLLFFKGCHLLLRGERSAPCPFSSLVRGWVPSLSMGAQLWPKSAHSEVTWI